MSVKLKGTSVILFVSKLLACLVASLFSLSAFADTYYKVGVGVSTYAIKISRKRGENFEDQSQAVNVSVGAYRETSDKSYWGAVIDVIQPIDREESLSGSGRILGFRPVDYLYFFNDRISAEAYAGVAQYEWRKTANGYYVGGSVRYNFRNSHWSVALDTKFYQDLAFDSDEGDDIVQGFNPGIKFLYRF